MKTVKTDMSKIKNSDDFKKAWQSMRECTPAETAKANKIIADIKDIKNQ
jgi:hypothetical protein